MQMLIKNLLKVRYTFLASIITFAITYLSLVKLGKQQISIAHLDKIEHTIAYFFLAITWLLAIKKAARNTKTKYIIVFCCIFFGIIIEVLQTTLTNYREASLLDALANSLGALIAMLVFTIKFEKKRAI